MNPLLMLLRGVSRNHPDVPKIRVTIDGWSQTMTAGETGIAAFHVDVPNGHQLTTLVLVLTPIVGAPQMIAVDSPDASAVVGLRFTLNTPGVYRLTLQAIDDLGRSDTSAKRREVVVT